MAHFRDDITGIELPVSNKSTQTIIIALAQAWFDGVITDKQYCMTYAEVCEPQHYPQAFGGGLMSAAALNRWKNKKSWE